MAQIVPHMLFTAHGNMPGGDQWSCGLRTLAKTPGLSTIQGNALAAAVAARWRTFNDVASPLFGKVLNATVARYATIEGVTLRELNADGVTVNQFEAIPAISTSNAGVSPITMPPQCALAVSLITARAGRTGKGRIYLPCIAATLGADGKITQANIDFLMSPITTLLNGMNTDLNAAIPGQRIAVQSSVAAAIEWPWTGTEGDYTGAAVTQYRVGNVVDTQRRRRASLIESYTSVALA